MGNKSQSVSAKRTEANRSQQAAPAFSRGAPPLHRLQPVQQALGNQGVLGRLQAKLTVNQSGDIYEQEADRVADAVMSQSSVAVPVTPSVSPIHSPINVHRKCAACTEEDEEHKLHRKEASSETGPGTSDDAPSMVHDVLTLPGQPLDKQTQVFFEQRFGRDFSNVRLHTNEQASESARAVNARAYTVGSDIVFRGAQYSPQTPEGKRLLAHELVHVVQQGHYGNGMDRPNPAGRNFQPEQPDGRLKDEAALHMPTSVRRYLPGVAVQRLACDDILNATEKKGESQGTEVERLVRATLVSQVMPKTFWPLSIPGASSREYRMEECGGFKTGLPGPRGFVDLTYINGRVLELAEVKIGTWPCLELAERQVRNYVAKGNDDKALKRFLGIDKFALMPTNRFIPPRDLATATTPVVVGWCEPGVIVYKAISKDRDETFLCSSISDKGAVDQFLEKAIGQAEASVDRYIDQAVNSVLEKVAEALNNTSQGRIPVDLFQKIISSIKARFLAMLRREMKKRLREYLQTALNELCAEAAVRTFITLKDLLKKLEKEMQVRILVPVLVPVATQLSNEIVKEVLGPLVFAGQVAVEVVRFLVKQFIAEVRRELRTLPQEPLGVPGIPIEPIPFEPIPIIP
jgi:hypothetical protein